MHMSYGVYEFSTEQADLLTDILSNNDLNNAFSIMNQYESLYDCRYNYFKSIDFSMKNMPIPWLLCWSGHLSCSTEVLKEIGGFDEWFNSWGGEDVEIGIRLHQAGCEFQLLSELETVHYPHSKDADSKQNTAMKNMEYIHDKHKMNSTKFMKDYNWEELLVNYEKF